MRTTLRQIANIVALVATIAVNGLTQALNYGGQDLGTLVNNNFDQLRLLPANYAFAIWGLIYTLLAVWAVYQALPSQRNSTLNARIGWWFVASCVFNCVWLLVFQRGMFVLSTVFIVGLLVSLALAYVGLRSVEAVSLRDHLLYRVPFSVYLGWVTVATVVNVGASLIAAGVLLPGLVTPLAIVTLAVAAVIATWLAFTQRDLAYAAVILWAFSAIAVRWSADPPVAIAAIVLGLVPLLAAATRYLPTGGARNRRLVPSN